ncbi:hypothetical protein N7495_004996 [Penicillium taxi]|uniref:uncharacterized protein n=1 Tax=Penicillium taxi TaxID=168475 RepID=UPI002545A654|nr:uncharacterized protein N7495_004996 [Penicillium taxi]KAJ5893305.1 hypothetical protein N7495_004996 [Penicillium taxi]
MDYHEPPDSNDHPMSESYESTKLGKRPASHIDDHELNPSSSLAKFRAYFQLKDHGWRIFCKRLYRLVEDSSTWEEVSHNDALVRTISQSFLNQAGPDFWGTEQSRTSYLAPEVVSSGRALRFPDDGYEMNLVLMNMIRGRALDRMRRASMAAAMQSIPLADASSSQPQGIKSENAEPDVTIVTGQDQIQSTFFIVCEEHGLTDRVCVPFDFFHSANYFIRKMEEYCGISDNADVHMQIHAEMPSLKSRYAVVYLMWSGVHFVVRPNSATDWQALTDRLECAWKAQNSGKLNVFEFEIHVVLKMEEEYQNME